MASLGHVALGLAAGRACGVRARDAARTMILLALLLRRAYPVRWFAPVAVAVIASHGLLDAMTDGGRGIALLWPWTTERFFLPWRPIPVAPIGARILSSHGLHVVLWEAVVFAPAWIWALWPRRRS